MNEQQQQHTQKKPINYTFTSQDLCFLINDEFVDEHYVKTFID